MSKKERVLVVVESPAKGKTIQKYLGDDYVVIACFGHCVDLAKGGKFGIGVDLSSLKPKYVLQEDKKKYFDAIINASLDCDKIYLASDIDREGEAISKHLKDRLASTGKPIFRISFNEITKAAILKAVSEPRDIDLNLFNSQQARRILDRIVGFLVSPMLREIYSQNLSAGRVQSVAIRMIVDREHDIKKFKPKEYWNIFADLSDGADTFRVKLDEAVNNKQQADVVLEDIKAGNYTVDMVNRVPKKEYPFPPLTTLVLQQLMSKKHGFSAEQTMTAAQACYESGYTTYIRTDSVRITDDAIKSIRDWLKTNNHSVPNKPNVYSVKATSADSHEAIRATNISNLPTTTMLSGDEKTLYDMVWRYTVSSQMNPAIFDTLEVHIKCGGHIFRASGKALTDKGFFEILGLPKDQKINIPNLTTGQKLSLVGKVLSEQNHTKPPARYSESNLIKDMDAKQIGRSSTMATILKNIISRNYVIKSGNTYTPTDLGIKITETLAKHFGFLNFNYSALMEKRLDDVAAGTQDYDKLMTEFYSLFSKELRVAIETNNCVSCAKCNGIMVQRENARGKYLSCSGCRNFKSLEATV